MRTEATAHPQPTITKPSDEDTPITISGERCLNTNHLTLRAGLADCESISIIMHPHAP